MQPFRNSTQTGMVSETSFQTIELGEKHDLTEQPGKSRGTKIGIRNNDLQEQKPDIDILAQLIMDSFNVENDITDNLDEVLIEDQKNAKIDQNAIKQEEVAEEASPRD